MKNVTDSLVYGRVAPVEFGPTTILLVAPSVALEYIKAQGWDTGCGRMPPMSEKARDALASYSAMARKMRYKGAGKIRARVREPRATAGNAARLR